MRGPNVAFDLSDYEPVASRIAKFYDAHPDGRIITELVHYLADTAVFRAELYVGDLLVATGWEEEVRGSSPVNRTSHLANAETGAIGRALANYNLAGSDPSKRASREEMAKVQRGGGDRQATGDRAPMTGGITAPQAGKIKALSKGLGKLAPANLDELSKSEASALIEALITESANNEQEDPF